MLFFLDFNWLELYKKFYGCRDPSHIHLTCHNTLFICKTYVSHKFTELILQDMSYPLAPGEEMAWGGGGGVKGRGELKQGSHFFNFWDKEADFF